MSDLPRSYSAAVRARGRTDEFMARPDRPESPVVKELRDLQRTVRRIVIVGAVLTLVTAEQILAALL